MAKTGKHAKKAFERAEPVVSDQAEGVGVEAHEPALGAEDALTGSHQAEIDANESAAVELNAEGIGLTAEEKKAKRRKTAKIAGISVVGVLAAAYLAGFAAFSFLFFPGTTIGDNDISLKTNDDVAALLNEAAESYAFTVEGQGVSLAMNSSDAGISFDTQAIIEDMRSRTSAWAWPYEVFQARDMAECVVVRYDTTALDDALRAACATINETATQPVNATIGYDAEADAIAVIPEQYGTLIDADEVVEYVHIQNNALSEQIELPQEVLVEAELRQDDERLAKAAEDANALMTVNVNLLMSGQTVASINAESMATWILMDENFAVTLDETRMNEWIAATAASCSTVGSERKYTRPDGKEVTVSGGDYGWQVDEEAFATLVRDAVANSQEGDVELPLTQTAQVYNGHGVADWGKRYVDVDLSEQHAYMYDAEGTLIWETDIVTGGPGASRATPTGVWDLNTNNGYAMLVGRKSDGSIDYETPVNYWMPFVRQSIGLHDANWRGSFGGSIYTYNGSHGCVNLPPSKARELHNIIEVGDVVITHW